MKLRLSYIIVFIAGTVFGIGLCMALAFYNIHQEMGKPLVGPRIFGDIRIIPNKFLSKEFYSYSKLDSEENVLFLEKDGVRFMAIVQDSNGITRSINTVSKDNPVDGGGFMMQPSQSPSKWECCYGGPMIKGKPSGELYWDFNFDGQFDTRSVYDENGGKKVLWIFINGDWHKVVGANRWRAKDDSAMFHFDPNTGWLQDDANSPEKHIDAAEGSKNKSESDK